MIKDRIISKKISKIKKIIFKPISICENNIGNKQKALKENKNFNENINIGDIITYIPPIDEEVGCGIYNWNYEYATSSETGETMLKNSNAKFRITKWRVLSVKEDKIEIVPYSVPKGKVLLQGPQGYNNAVYLLNKVCKKLYSYEKNGIIARSINMNDFEEGVKLNNKIAELDRIKENAKNFNKQDELPYKKEKSYYPIIYEREIKHKIMGQSTEKENLDISDSGNELIDRKDSGSLGEGKKQAETGIWPIKTYFNTSNYKKTSNLLGGKNSKYTKVLLPNGNKTEYWVASRCIGHGTDCAHYDVRFVYKGFIRASRLYASDDIAGSRECALFPVVSLPIKYLNKLATQKNIKIFEVKY